MDDVLNKFEDIDNRVNKEVQATSASASDGLRELSNLAIDGGTHAVLFAQNRLIDTAIYLRSDPTKRGVRYIRYQNDMKRLFAFEKDVDDIETSMNEAIEANDDDALESLEAQLYRAKLGVQTYQKLLTTHRK